MSRRALALAAALLAPSGGAQSLSLQAESEEMYANLPFVLSLSAADFDETPQPAPPELEIQGCEITFLGVSPSVSQQIQIINGRRSEWKEVTFVYRWRVQPSAPGRYQVPPLTVAQGAKSATSRAAAFTVQAMQATSDMIVRMTLPERPVWVGETFEVAVEWLLNRDVESYEFVVPLFDSDAVSVAPGAGGAQTVGFSAGVATVELPLLRSSVVEAGQTYTRLRFPARVTPLRPGTLDVLPVRVAARLEAGSVRDAFGFRRTRTALFEAQGARQRLTVRPLPQTGRPPGFVNAVGQGFAISVQASRSVVQVGDPIDLSITVRGDGDLEGLSLPPLGGDGALPPDLFSVPAAAPFGVVDDAANAKTFEVTVRVLSADAREVPAIAFPYFDPATGAYATAASDPIALSVEGGAVIGAADVAVATPRPEAEQRPGPAPAAAGSAASSSGIASLLGADMSLSSPRQTLQRPWGSGVASVWLAGLYLAPFALAALRMGWLRTEGRRRRGRRVALAQRELKRTLQSQAPAREAAPAIIRALRNLAEALGLEALPQSALVERLETTAFDPSAADQPLPGETVAAVADMAREWTRAAAATNDAAAATAAVLLAGAALLLPAALTGAAEAEAQGEQGRPAFAENPLGDARRLYHQALDEADRVRRVRLFAEAERRFRAVAQAHPNAPSLLVDWGNAALGAGDFGHAVLAWRRALTADPGNERARRNLLWLRNNGPAWLPRPSDDGALASLLFWRNQLAASQLHWVAGAAFALAVLLWTPWSRRRTRLARRLALVPLGVWAATTAAAALGGSEGAGVVLTDGATLRSADSFGAPPAFAHPLPAGTEVTVRETRDVWVRIALADGTSGWAAASAVAMVAP